MKRSLFTASLLLACSLSLQAQLITESRNGATMSPAGDLRVLVIFAEINYNDPAKNAGGGWPQGQVPAFASDWFDPSWTGNPQKEMTKFFADMSLGNFRMTGDWLDQGGQCVTVNENGFIDQSGGGLFNTANLAYNICLQASQQGFNTSSGFTPADFDIWRDTISNPGTPRTLGTNNAFDHVVFVIRNYAEFFAGGVAPTGLIDTSSNFLFGHGVDSWTLFEGTGFPLRRHEFGHHLLGAGNFHSCGGHDNANQAAYFIPTQGGWGLMSSYAGSLKCINAWERRRLEWTGPGKNLPISTGTGGSETDTDLDATNLADTGTYVLRDFVTTGDALRIRLPFIPGTEFPQWLWIENHQGYSPFDNHNNVGCQTPFQPGLYMYVQVDRDQASTIL